MIQKRKKKSICKGEKEEIETNKSSLLTYEYIGPKDIIIFTLFTDMY